MDTTVSVIIPTHNRWHVLPRALDSVLAQNYPIQDIIVIDDGSTDDTAILVGRHYPTVTVVRQDNQGVSSARNLGLSKVSTEWVALLDSDDAWEPAKLERQFAALQTEPRTRVCHTEEIWIRNGRRVNQMKKHAKSGGWLFERSLALCCISPSSALLHRSVFDDYGQFDTALPACEDYDLWLRITAFEAVCFEPTPLTIKYGGHADQLSRKFWGMDRFRIQAIEKLLAHQSLSPEYRGLALDTLLKKLQILVMGAQKRDNQDILDLYGPKLAYWTLQAAKEEATP